MTCTEEKERERNEREKEKGGENKVLDELFAKALELEAISEEGYTGAGANINILQ